mgnify:CR=1 FL=1
MLGLDDPMIWLAYLLCILSALLCLVYGAINWNKGGEPITEEDIEWAREEKEEVEEAL